MEQMVGQHACKLSSEDCNEVARVCRRIEDHGCEAHLANDPSARLKYSRLRQELLAYKRGALVQKLLNQVLAIESNTHKNCSTMHLSLQFHSILAVADLSESQAVAEFCLRDEKTVCMLPGALMEAFLHCKAGLSDQGLRKGDCQGMWLRWTMVLVRGLANFARVSRHFRKSLQQYGRSLFPALEFLLSEDFEKTISRERGYERVAVYTHIAPLVHIFVLFGDTQQWAIDQGLIRIHLAIHRKMMRLMNSMFQGEGAQPAFLGGMKVEDLNIKISALETKERWLLDLEKKIMHSKNPQRASAWRNDFLKDCREDLVLESECKPVFSALLGLGTAASATSKLDLEKSPKSVKSLAAYASKRRETPIVCSWEFCETGSVIDAGRLFSKCASCSLAYYCR